MAATSLRPPAQPLAVDLVPTQLFFDNYLAAFSRMHFLRAFINSLLYAVPCVVATVLSSSVTAYAFARLRWPGRDLAFFSLLATMMLPSQVTFIPLYVLYAKLGWIGSYLPLIVPTFFGSPFYIFLLRQFFRAIPRELADAARVDGAGEVRIFLNIILPLSKPALVTVALLTFIDKWGDFFGPLVFVNNPDLYPLSLALQTFQSAHRTDWPLTMAGAVIMTFPVLLLFLLGQRQIMRGLTIGSGV
jgi:multiple sugar transport system permease protein